MEGMQRRGVRSRLRWTLGSLMVVVALSALVTALVRPFVSEAPPAGEVIGISFDLQTTRTADGQTITGLAPKMAITKQSGTEAPIAKP